MKAFKYIATFTLFLLILSACNLPGQEQEKSISVANMVLTSAVQTVEAQLTLNPNLSLGSTPQPTLVFPTLNSPDSNGISPTIIGSSETPITLCDVALFIDDITVSDGEDFSPGEIFTKTWRLQNIGSCTWTPGYELIFFDGDPMNGPVSKQLTNVAIASGEMVNISVELTAPNEAKTYTGYWKLRNANGVIFTLTNDQAFWVEIDVVAPTATPGPKIETISLTMMEDGAVQSDGFVSPSPNVGDTTVNLGLQAFFQFDISLIPVGATINEVVVSFNNFDTLGDPFLNLGCLRGYSGDYFPLDAADFVTTSGSSMKWCDSDQLSISAADEDVKSDLQNAIGNTYLEYRLQFNDTETNNDGNMDMVRFGTVSLKVTYQIEP